MSDTYCNVENAFLEAGEYFRSHGVTVHVVDDFQGHTLDGWEASWRGIARPHGTDVPQDLVVERPPVAEPELEPPPDVDRP